jgi:hypothetical protein
VTRKYKTLTRENFFSLWIDGRKWQKMDKAKPNTKLKQILHWFFTSERHLLYTCKHCQIETDLLDQIIFYFHKNDHLKYVLAIYNCCNLLSYLYLFFCAYWLETWWVNLKDKNQNISSLPFKETWHNASLYFYRMGKDLCKNSLLFVNSIVKR